MIAVGDCPNRADRFSVYVKWNEQSLFGERHSGAQVRIGVFPKSEQYCGVAVQHITARSKITRGTSAEVGAPSAG